MGFDELLGYRGSENQGEERGGGDRKSNGAPWHWIESFIQMHGANQTLGGPSRSPAPQPKPQS